MQSTGHTSTQALSFVPMQGSAMMYIPISRHPPLERGFYTSRSRRSGWPSRYVRTREEESAPGDADLVSEILPVRKDRVAHGDLRPRRKRAVDLRVGRPGERRVGSVGDGDHDRALRGVELGDRPGGGQSLFGGKGMPRQRDRERNGSDCGKRRPETFRHIHLGEENQPPSPAIPLRPGRESLTAAERIPTIRRFSLPPGGRTDGKTLDGSRASIPERQRVQNEPTGSRRRPFGPDRRAGEEAREARSPRRRRSRSAQKGANPEGALS